MQLQFGGVLDGEDALVRGDELAEHVEERGLAAAGAAGDDDVEPEAHQRLEEPREPPGYGAESDQAIGGQLLGEELADGDGGPTPRDRRQHDVDAAAVGQARLEPRALFGQRPAHVLRHVPRRREQALLGEHGIGALQLSAPLDPDFLRAVDEDLGDLGIVEERDHRLEERAQAVGKHRHGGGPSFSAYCGGGGS